MGRIYEDWIEGFISHTVGMKCPAIFREWAGISAVAAALQRTVYSRVNTQHLFPNLYILLIGPPGTGKTNAIRHARECVRKLSTIPMTPSRLTQRVFYNELLGAGNTSFDSKTQMPEVHHSLTAMIDEFSVFCRPANTEFMADLAEVYDCPDPFEYRTATQGEIIAPNSYFNLIGGATPKYLGEAWKSTTLDQGFPSRVIIVYSKESKMPQPLEPDDVIDERERVKSGQIRDLANDLEYINQMKGRFTWSEESYSLYNKWCMTGLHPRPKDPRLEAYCERRHTHLGKMCMIVSASRGEDMEITAFDYKRALEMLIRVERSMPRAIDAMGANPLRDAAVMVHNFVKAESAKSENGVPERKIRNLLLNEVDPMRVQPLINELEAAEWVYCIGDAPARRFFVKREDKDEDSS